ncbi:transcriptional factor B3 family protein [Arabidopsis thaliana]|uniref:Transcriptional factor B3 family protein n=2 Tax=Arabidopsis thaliana TaxID=3702 RepID=F4IPS6_ARATH|nr:transcriptional factor B3 family protein [Arabidopsis thaliana]AEC07613.2 transcriptional factor B3 family protein [Arabidopsis thaliana]|eukprot:NP_001318284.1 transcriptional factor B3 family protein [Arabidopsis thaliana]
MVLNSSDLGPSRCDIRDLPAPSSTNDQGKTELARKKKVKRSNTEIEADASSSDNSCFVALVTASNLRKDALYLPQDLTSSVGLERKYREIVVTDERERRSWALDLRFNKSSDTFYISRGWRSFCDENGKKPGGVFVFKLVGNRETPVLSFCSTESINDGTQGHKNNKYNCMELKSKKKRMRCRDSTSPSQNRFMTLTLTHDNLIKSRRQLPLPFMRENGLVKPGIINLLGKDGTKWEVNLRREANGTMYLGKGWKDFTIANGLKTGESFTLEAVLENGTRMLSLVSTQSTSDRNQQGECLKDSEKESNSTEPSSGKRKAMINRGVRRKSFPASQNRCVTLKLTHDNLIKSRRYLPLSFTRDNGLDKPGMIFLLGKTGRKWEANLLREASGRIVLTGKGWKEFAMANGLKSGELFTLEAILEKGTPMLSLVNTQSTNYRSQQGECSRDSEKESSICAEPSRGNKKWKATNNRKERRDSSSAIQNRYVTLTLTPEDVRACTLILPSQFMKANGINKLGKKTLLGQNRKKWFAYLLSKSGFVALGSGWKGFCEANGVKTGESFNLEYIDEQDTTPVFKFCSNSVEISWHREERERNRVYHRRGKTIGEYLCFPLEGNL